MDKNIFRVLSFGAGTQSTTILYLMIDGIIEKADAVIFADTGNEPDHIYRHLENCRILCEQNSLPFYKVSAGSIIGDARKAVNDNIRFSNPPFWTESGILIRKCTRDYKVRPIDRKVKELAPKGVQIERLIGFSLDEAERVKKSIRKNEKFVYPLMGVDENGKGIDGISWSRSDCIRYLEKKGITATLKSSCVICPYHNDDYWEWMKTSYPVDFQRAVDFDLMIRQGIQGTTEKLFLHRRRKPLAIAVSQSEKQVKFGFLKPECVGCGL